jgi:curved DNA-binding protein CbpA
MNLHEAEDLLGIKISNVTESELKSAYRKKAQLVHPDKGGSAKDFIQVRKAYTLLRDHLLRADNTNPNNSASANYSSGFKESTDNDYKSKTYTEPEFDQVDFWRKKYQEVYQKYQQTLLQNQKLWEVTNNYEAQINDLILVFNSGQKMLVKATNEFQNQLKKLDEEYHRQMNKLKKDYNQTWLGLFFGKKMDQNEYIRRNNLIIQKFQKSEQAIIAEYYSTTQAIYKEMLKQFYQTLS